MLIFFDIETVYDDNHKQDIDSLMEKYWDKCDFLPELTKILTICVWYKSNEWEIRIKNIEWTEEEQIKEFFLLAEKNNLCWFNILNFDIPFVIKRALHYWIRIPDRLKFYWKKPWELSHLIDLQEVYKINVWWWIWNLDLVSKHLWIDSPKDKISWKELQQYHDDWKDEDIIEYCKKDVKACIEVYEKFLLLNLI